MAEAEADRVKKEIEEIEEEIRKTKYNKATQFHVGQLKAKLAKLRDEHIRRSEKKAGAGYSVKKTGDATAILVGFPSVGKSTILNRLTNAESKVGHYDFTTLNIIPGMMKLNHALIQLLDIPGMIEGVSRGKGRGREILSVVRNADIIIFVLDATKKSQLKVMTKKSQLDVMRDELYNAGFRLDQEPPDVTIKRRSGGGIDIGSAVKLTKMSLDQASSILREFKVLNAEVVIRSNLTAEQFIDCVMGNRVYVPSLVVINKTDLASRERLRVMMREVGECIAISAEKDSGMDEMREEIWKRIGLIRIYLKRVGRNPDMDEPLIMVKGATIKDVAEKIHRVFEERFRFARVWGSSKFGGQKLGMDYVLHDEDIVEFHMY
jgi:ribosome-interacting GTPase 1